MKNFVWLLYKPFFNPSPEIFKRNCQFHVIGQSINGPKDANFLHLWKAAAG